MNRRRWFDWHSWAGFQLSILLSFVLVTGTFATVSIELDWLANPSVRAEQGQPDQLAWGAMFEAAQARFPNARLDTLHAPPAPWFNAEIIGMDADEQRFRIYIDPVSNEVVGTGRWNNWQRFFRQTHRHLMLPINIGVTLVCLLAIPLLVSLVTSFAIYKRWWRGFFKSPRRGDGSNPVKHSRRFWGDVHRLCGVWSLWFVLLMVVTSFWYLGEQWGLDAKYPEVPQQPEGPLSQVTGDGLDAMVEHTRSVYPSLEIKRIFLASRGGALTLIQGQADALLVRPRANQLAFANHTGELIDLRRGEKLSAHVRVSEAADPLHFGTFGGTITRYLWFVFGVMLSTLSLTGVYLFGLRALRSLPDKKSWTTRHAWAVGWASLARFTRWPSVTVLSVCLALAIGVFVLGYA